MLSHPRTPRISHFTLPTCYFGIGSLTQLCYTGANSAQTLSISEVTMFRGRTFRGMFPNLLSSNLMKTTLATTIAILFMAIPAKAQYTPWTCPDPDIICPDPSWCPWPYSFTYYSNYLGCDVRVGFFYRCDCPGNYDIEIGSIEYLNCNGWTLHHTLLKEIGVELLKQNPMDFPPRDQNEPCESHVAVNWGACWWVDENSPAFQYEVAMPCAESCCTNIYEVCFEDGQRVVRHLETTLVDPCPAGSLDPNGDPCVFICQ